ncbi:cytochrome c biogenesis protein [Cesiribacter andamanensis]|uniref:Cytochrome c-type biogenesis protein CcsB n=1 Tax=Cesiribacter andamanensis AMV16 TaxID=1279009 RepID=M7N676_9BACT|nr:cytochrome c biogenesis protein CcsA [Cesiribacter andamanensis]EMR02741.1 cytochrome c-type biogenesis protein CcsB [Cesiribacter andamanensis AMV16]
MKYLLSTKVSFVLMLAFAGTMAWATFLENDHGTAAARSMVYEAWWFEVLMIWLAINFLAHIQHYKLFTKKRWPVGLFHIAFVLIIVGAGVTRFFGKEGIIHIREGKAESAFFSSINYLQLAELGKGGHPRHFEQALSLQAHAFSPVSQEVVLGDARFTIRIEEYLQGAHQEFVAGPDTLLAIAVAQGTGREDYLIRQGERLPLGELSLATAAGGEGAIELFRQDSLWMIRSPRPLHIVDMTTQKMGVLKAGEASPLQLRSLYQMDSAAFLVKAIHEGKQLIYHIDDHGHDTKDLPDVVKLRITDQAGKEVFTTYTELVSRHPKRHVFFAGDKKYSLAYGPRQEYLPFALRLDAFELERYPGSQSPSSYASRVQVVDGETTFPYRIFMNNVLDYRGYRFYQASYDTDEKGTILSVSQDRPGTYITYLAYSLLTIGMFFTFFARGSRFSILNRRLQSMRAAEEGASRPAESGAQPGRGSLLRRRGWQMAGAVVALLLLLGLKAMAHGGALPDASGAIVPQEQAGAYGRLIVQDLDGRMKPLNTLANEITRKLSGKSTIAVPHAGGEQLLTAEQFLLAVQLDPQTFSALPLIKVDPDKGGAIFAALQHAPVSSISFRELLDDEGRYILYELVEEANRLKPAERNEGHKELLKVDERFNIFYAILSGDFLRLFPNKLDANNTWFTAMQSNQGFAEDDALFVKNITPMYLAGLQKGIATGEWKEAEEILNYISLYQQKAGEQVYPSEERLKAELLYNQLRLGNRLFGLFWLLGLGMLALAIVKLFASPRWLTISWTWGLVLGWIGLAAFTLHLGLRWYVAQHAPWSDGFEMLIFVAWGVLLSGLLFAKHSHFTVPIGILFSGTLLFVAFLDWLNPEITNLMPVLNSYWLKIHVAVIVSGYAPLALAALLALLLLLLLLFKPASPSARWWQSMQELSVVNEMAITIGLFLLTIGTFLGGVWANESWGRYWAWDPKETWALISIMIYGFVLHLRLVPAFKNALLFNLVCLWSFSSIIMTSFGVNYYLSGLHSYASGDPVPVPQWLYWAVALLALVSVLAIVKYRNLSAKEQRALLAV